MKGKRTVHLVRRIRAAPEVARRKIDRCVFMIFGLLPALSPLVLERGRWFPAHFMWNEPDRWLQQISDEFVVALLKNH